MSMRVKKLNSPNLVASRSFKVENVSPPVDARPKADMVPLCFRSLLD